MKKNCDSICQGVFLREILSCNCAESPMYVTLPEHWLLCYICPLYSVGVTPKRPLNSRMNTTSFS